LLLLTLAAPAAPGQDHKREAEARTLRGIVLDKDGNAVASSAVYLKNLKTQAVSTSITDDKGRYHFNGLDPSVDYEVHAVHENLESPKRSISSLDSRKEIVIELKLKQKKKAK